MVIQQISVHSSISDPVPDSDRSYHLRTLNSDRALQALLLPLNAGGGGVQEVFEA